MIWNFHENGHDPCFGCKFINRPNICKKCDGPDDLDRALEEEGFMEDFLYEDYKNRRDASRKDDFGSMASEGILQDW